MRIATKPNIVLNILDDDRFLNSDCCGAELRTSKMDSVASEGLRNNWFVPRAICSFLHAVLLTGSSNSHTVRMEGIPSFLRAPNPDDLNRFRREKAQNAENCTKAPMLSGFHSVAQGKWHLSPEYEDRSERARASRLRQCGSDQFNGFLRGQTDQYRPDLITDYTEVVQ